MNGPATQAAIRAGALRPEDAARWSTLHDQWAADPACPADVLNAYLRGAAQAEIFEASARRAALANLGGAIRSPLQRLADLLAVRVHNLTVAEDEGFLAFGDDDE